VPKIKTHKATAKRFRYSGSGKLMRTRGGGKGGKGQASVHRDGRGHHLGQHQARAKARALSKKVRAAPRWGTAYAVCEGLGSLPSRTAILNQRKGNTS
jgi:hypothetical protein